MTTLDAKYYLMPTVKSTSKNSLQCVFLALLLMMTSPAWAAVTLHGIVSLDRERGAPVAGVEVSAHGANPVTTGNDGQFVLIFPNGRPGQDVRLGVKRTGWIVVNDIMLDHRLPDNGTTQPFEIIVCKNAERKRRRAEFYRAELNQAVEQTYESKLAELVGPQAIIAQERDHARQLVDEGARQTTTRKPEEIGGIHREALRLFLDGQADTALQVLSEERLQRDALKTKKQLNQAVQGWLLKADLLTTKFDFVGAGRAYEQAAKYAPNSHHAQYRHSYFHQQQNLFSEARRGPPLATPTTGVNASRSRSTVEERKAHEETLKVSRDLAQKDPDVYLPDVAMTLNNLGVLHRAENRMAEARKVYDEALDLYRDLAKKNPDVYLPDVAMTLNNLGVLHRAENRMVEARKAFEEALSIYRPFVIKSPGRYERNIQRVERNLAELPQ